MGNTMERQMSLRKKATDAISRLDVLETELEEIRKGNLDTVMAVNQAFSQLSQKLDESREILDAVVGLIGAQAVQEAIQGTRLAQMVDAANATKANIAKALAEGKLVKTEVVTAKSLVVGRETKPDGTEIPPGYAAIRFSQVKEAFQTKLMGLKVGEALDTEAGGKFEVVELYEEVVAAPAAPSPGSAIVEGEVVTPSSPAAESTPAPVVQ